MINAPANFEFGKCSLRQTLSTCLREARLSVEPLDGLTAWQWAPSLESE